MGIGFLHGKPKGKSFVLSGNAKALEVISPKTFYNTNPKNKIEGLLTSYVGSVKEENYSAWINNQISAAQNNWQDICYGNGMFVAVNYGGLTNSIATSYNGIDWTIRATPNFESGMAIAYGNGLFVAISMLGTNQIITSPDGITWTLRASPVPSNEIFWYAVTYGQGLFVVVGSNGATITSPDGITWTRRVMELNSWRSICYGNGIFISVANDGTNRLATSLDGITWSFKAIELRNWVSCCYGDGIFVAIENTKSGRALYSTDGFTWTESNIEPSEWYHVTYGNGTFMAVGQNRTINSIAISTDGRNWTTKNITNPAITGGCYSNGRFTFVSSDGRALCMDSTSTIREDFKSYRSIFQWKSLLMPSFGDMVWSAICYGDLSPSFAPTSAVPLYVALVEVIPNQAQTIATSPDGITWTTYADPISSPPIFGWSSICFGQKSFRDGQEGFVAVGSQGIMSSYKGVTWTSRVTTNKDWTSVCYGKNLFVAVSTTGTNRVITSSNGITWNLQTQAITGLFTSVCYGNGVFVAAISDNTSNNVMWSTNGANWTATSAKITNISAIAYGNGVFVAISPSNLLSTSFDGKTWTARSSLIANSWKSICYGNGLFVAVATSGANRILVSEDGITWDYGSPCPLQSWKSICYGNGTFIAVSSDGTARSMQSPIYIEEQ